MRRPFLLFAGLPLLLHAQQFDYDWSGVISSVPPGTAGYIDDLEVNSMGNAVGYGYMGNVTGFDLGLDESVYIIDCNAENAFLCMYDNEGGILWGGPFTSEERVLVHDLEVLPNNDFLVTLTASAPVDMEPLFGVTDVTTTNTGGGEFIVLAKYDFEGTLLWALPLEGNYTGARPEIAALPDGSFYLTCEVTTAGPSSFVDIDPGTNTTTLSLSGLRNFIAYYTADADLVWHFDYGAGLLAGGLSPMDVGVDGNNDLIVVGLQDADVDFDPAPGDQTTPLNGPTAYVAKYTVGGSLAWVRTITGMDITAQTLWAYDMLVNPQDEIFVSGRFFEGSIDLDPGPGEDLVPSAGGHDIWMMRFDPAGAVVWAQTFGTTAHDNSEDMCFLGNGDILLGQKDQIASTGAFPLSIISAADGSVLQQYPQVWQQTIGALGSGFGELYISGQFNGLAMGDLTSGNVILQGGDDIYLSHYVSEITSAIMGADPTSAFELAPNPATEQLVLRTAQDLPSGASIQVVDAMGKTLRSIPWSGNGTTIQVGDLVSGPYILRYADRAPQRFLVAH
ncbi:MAG: T9SS type A sorting domain-containing protein [Flavobacteriales bacterium]|nr:T9SS type A sorting domain-containing protein [Flavobacteriales bacterium]